MNFASVIAFLPPPAGAVFAAALGNPLAKRAAVAAVVVLVFALAAHRLRGVNRSGAVAGAGLSFLMYVSAGAEVFVVVAVLFCLTALSTRLGQARKDRLGVAERRGGRRWRQVVANLGVATLAALVSLQVAHSLMLLVLVAALAEAAADTVGGEVGQAFGGNVYLISNFQPVQTGTNGGISLVGTLAGAVDALAGATLQRRGWLSNDGVNLVSTAAGAAIAWLLLR